MPAAMTKTKKVPIRKGFSLPTKEELRQLQFKETQASDVFKTNLFQIQIRELLNEICVDYSQYALDEELIALKDAIFSIAEQNIFEQCLNVEGIKLRCHINDKPVSLDYRQPSRMDIIGSFLLRTAVKPMVNIDVAVEIPKECFVAKDFLNYRYFDKRALFVGYLATQLKERHDLFSQVKIASFCKDTRKPILLLYPSKKDKKNSKLKYVIRLFPTISEDTFQITKLVPSRCNLRSNTNQTPIATPHYNNAIMEDMFMRRHLQELHSLFTDCPSFAEASMLLKVWLRVRVLDENEDSMNGFILSMLLIYLLSQKRLNKQMGAGQIFKVTMNFLGHENISDQGILLPCEDNSLTTDQMNDHVSFFEMNFLDSTGFLNLMGRLSFSAYEEICHEARLTMKLIDNGTIESFRSCFIEKTGFFCRYDQYFSLPSFQDQLCDSSTHLDDMFSPLKYITKLVRQALGDRCIFVRLIQSCQNEWDLSSSSPLPSRIIIGVLLNRVNAERIIDRGPSADDHVNAKLFRDFWKSKAELRRFKDGSIVEALVWTRPHGERYKIIEDILRHIFSTYVSKFSPDSLMSANSQIMKHLAVGGNGYDESVRGLWQAFDRMTTCMKSLNELPLNIVSIQPTDPAFRYTSVFQPEQHPLAFAVEELSLCKSSNNTVSTLLRPYRAIMQFEKSSRWPDTLEAIQCTKTAFYVQLSKSLEDKNIHAIATEEYLEVWMDGYAFQITLFYERELTLLHRPNEPESKNRSIELRRACMYAPHHGSLIHALHLMNANYGPTVRLVTQWLNSHMFSDHISIEAVELLVAYVFINCYEYAEPSSALVGFLRFLRFIYSFDWERFPLIVDLNQILTPDDVRNIRIEFDESRKRSNSPAMYITSGYETRHSVSSWTAKNPEKVILSQICHLARTTYLSLHRWLESSDNYQSQLKCMMNMSVIDYDVVLKIDPRLLPLKKKPFQGCKLFQTPMYRNLASSEVLLVGFDPLGEYLSALKEKFGHLAIFFRNSAYTDKIGIVWRPEAFLLSPFRIGAAQNVFPLTIEKKKAQSIPHIASILSDIKIQGNGMIDCICLN